VPFQVHPELPQPVLALDHDPSRVRSLHYRSLAKPLPNPAPNLLNYTCG
jgi:hypothetical protein